MLEVHPTHPQQRLIYLAAEVLQKGGIIIYPTDSAYAIGCLLDNHDGLARIRRFRQLEDDHNFTLMCRDLSELSQFAKVDNVVFRLLKAHIPGPYTFVMRATKDVPRRMQHAKRKTIGLRVPDHPVAKALLEELNLPLLSVSLILPNEDLPVADVEDLSAQFIKQVDEIMHCGSCGIEPTSVIDLSGAIPEIIRVGKGDVSLFGS